jgi:RNA polymerase sigma-70 factor (ECF subfamily)
MSGEIQAAVPMSAAFLERLRRRDPEALSTAVREHARCLYRAARGLRCTHQEAEYLVQDVFITFIERLNSFEGRSQLRTWLFGILHHKILERRRAAAIAERNDPIDQVLESRFDTRGKWARPPADIERLLLSKEIGEYIRGCMDRLTADQREAFVLREMEGLGTSEICKILGVSVTNFGVLLFRARAKLRECLESKGWNT